MKVIGITQARIGSSRLPRKILLTAKGKSFLQYHLERASRSMLVEKWIVATTQEEEAELICQIARDLSLSFYQGSLEDVLDRFYQAVKEDNPDYIVRITSDCPLGDPTLIDEAVAHSIENKLTYYYNRSRDTYPDGFDVEVFTFASLQEAWAKATEKTDREHVTAYLRRNYPDTHPSAHEKKVGDCYSKLRLTLDNAADQQLLAHLIETVGEDKPWATYAEYLLKNQELIS